MSLVQSYRENRRRKGFAPMEQGFVEPLGRFYIDFLAGWHRYQNPEWYLEVGTQKGRSLRPVTCRAVAVDPEFILEAPSLGSKKELHLIQDTSDNFFASGFLEKNEIKIDFAFLDGMHLFEFLLRDFIGTEAQTAPGAVIAMHDCVPRNFIMTDRDWDKSKTKAWSGDVWKLLPILAEYRPELEITVWDCPPTGLVTVTGLDPANRVLSEAYDEIWEKYQAMSLKDFGIETLLTRFPMNSSLDHPAGKAG